MMNTRIARNLARGLGVFALLVLLGSCIGVESTISFDRDGSGTMRMEYRISKMLTEMGEEAESEAPLPLSEEELRESFQGREGVELRSVSQREDEQDVYISAEFVFESIEKVSSVEDFASMPMTYEQTGGRSTFSMLISEGHEPTEETESNPEMEAMLQQMFAGYEFVFVVNAPSRIQSHTVGELSADGRTVRYVLPILEMDKLEEETRLTVVW